MSYRQGINHFGIRGALFFSVLLLLTVPGWAGPPRGAPRAGIVLGGPISSTWALGVQPQRYFYPNSYYVVPYQAPILVYSPYSPAYYLPPTAVVTLPFFCVLDNHGFVSRVALLDHIAGTHKIPLAAAATICPDGLTSCIFPSY